MVQPPLPADAQGGHPEPEPMPFPEPEPPQPIPPPEPVPAPEPPHQVEEATGPLSPGPLSPGPVADALESPTLPNTDLAATPTLPSTGLATTPPATLANANTTAPPTTSIAWAEAPQEHTGSAIDFIDAGPPAPPVEFPPVGAYPGEPGHTDEVSTSTELLGPVQTRETVQFHPSARWPDQPTEPWHAQHERTGEWQTAPPEHLAWQHSPPAELQDHPEPGTQPPPWQVPLTYDAQPRRRRAGLWVSLALTVTLLLCGGGAISAYFLISNADTGKGAPDPATAANRFLTAVYTQQDASAADDLVCRDARNADKLAARVTQIKDYANGYDGPTFRWSEPAVSGQTKDRASVSVQLTMTTDDEKTAQQTLTITTVHKTGWLVCDVAG